MVSSHLEYAQFFWSPFRKNIATIKNVQRRATNILRGMKGLSYIERLNNVDLPTLVYRRNRGNPIEVFNMMNGIYDQKVEMQLLLKDKNTRGHQNKLYKERSRTKIR